MKTIVTYLALLVLLFLVSLLWYCSSILTSTGTETIHFIEPETEYASFGELVNDPALKGKVLYVDFWHTGCGPCLVEFTRLPALKAHFSQEDKLAFLYLGKDRSVPGEKIRWKKMILDKQLSGYHYFITDQQFDAFWNEAVQDTTILRAFPHYLIVDKEGKIVDNNAPRVSSQALPAILKAQL
jgi:thiol-disulfide isomerase/thioredoxin